MSFLRNLYFFQGQKYTSFGKNILHRESASLGHSATGHSGCIARLRAQGPAHQPAGVPERGGPAGAAHHASQACRPRPHEPRQTELGTHLATLWHFPFSIIHHKIAKYCPSPVCRLGDRRVPRRAPLPDPPGEGRPRPRLLHAHPLHWRQAPAVGQLQRGECPSKL